MIGANSYFPMILRVGPGHAFKTDMSLPGEICSERSNQRLLTNPQCGTRDDGADVFFCDQSLIR